ncbi:hypothetical protein JCM16303_004785 [Sporobolomyces ruberrimus]
MGTQQRTTWQFPQRPPTLRSIDPAFLTGDESLEGIPPQFVRDVLRDLAPRLLSGINCTSLDPASTPAPDKQLPTHARCTFDPSLSPGPPPLAPNFLLALTFPARDSNLSPPTRILVPCHSLLYALFSPLLSLAATRGGTTASLDLSNPASTSSASLLLPVIGPIELPSLPAFSILHTFLHTRSMGTLQHALTTKLPSTSRLPSPPPSPHLGHSPPRGPSASPTSTGRDDDDERLELLNKIQDLRRTVIKLEISDPELWQVMESSWYRIVSRTH